MPEFCKFQGPVCVVTWFPTDLVCVCVSCPQLIYPYFITSNNSVFICPGPSLISMKLEDLDIEIDILDKRWVVVRNYHSDDVPFGVRKVTPAMFTFRETQ